MMMVAMDIFLYCFLRSKQHVYLSVPLLVLSVLKLLLFSCVATVLAYREKMGVRWVG